MGCNLFCFARDSCRKMGNLNYSARDFYHDVLAEPAAVKDVQKASGRRLMLFESPGLSCVLKNKG